jgi:Zn-dependent peptidase ImmA (M78 family)
MKAKKAEVVYLPKSVLVLGIKYKVKLTDSRDYLGLCDSQLKTIYISKHQTAREAFHTLLHELIHAWQFRVGVHQAISREMLEIISEGLATVLLECYDMKPKLRATK